MATLIDSLVIQLGLDAKGLKKGSQDVQKNLGNIEKSTHANAKAFRLLTRSALIFFSVLTAGEGLKSFIASNTSSNVQLRLMARNIGISISALATWQKVAKAVGATGADVSSSLLSLRQQFNDRSTRPHLAQAFAQLHVPLEDANGKMRNMRDLLIDLSTASKSFPASSFVSFGANLGLTPGFVSMLEEGPDKIKRLYQAFRSYAPAKRDVDASLALNESWVRLTSQAEAFGRTILTDVTPELESLMHTISSLVDENQAWIRQDIDRYAKQIATAFKNVDWEHVAHDFRDVGAAIVYAAKACAYLAREADKLSKTPEAKALNSVLPKDKGRLIVDLAEGYMGYKFLKPFIKPLFKLGRKIVGSRIVKGIARTADAAAEGLAAIGEGRATSAAGVAARGLSAEVAVPVSIGLFDANWMFKNPDTLNNLPPLIKYDPGNLTAFIVFDTIRQKYFGRSPSHVSPAQSSRQISPNQLSAYRSKIASLEGARYDQMGGYHGAYAGKYQMSQAAISDAARFLHEPIPTQAQFLADPAMQDRFFDAYTLSNAAILRKKNPAFAQLDTNRQLALLAYAHNQGAGGADSFMRTGIARRDGFGTSGLRYSQAVLSGLSRPIGGMGQQTSSVTINAPITVYGPDGDTRKIVAGVETYFNHLREKAYQANSGLA